MCGIGIGEHIATVLLEALQRCTETCLHRRRRAVCRHQLTIRSNPDVNKTRLAQMRNHCRHIFCRRCIFCSELCRCQKFSVGRSALSMQILQEFIQLGFVAQVQADRHMYRFALRQLHCRCCWRDHAGIGSRASLIGLHLRQKRLSFGCDPSAVVHRGSVSGPG